MRNGRSVRGPRYATGPHRRYQDVAPEIQSGFEREARAVAALNQPNICTLHDVGPDYLVMEYVEGAPVALVDSSRKLLDIAVRISDGAILPPSPLMLWHTEQFCARNTSLPRSASPGSRLRVAQVPVKPMATTKSKPESRFIIRGCPEWEALTEAATQRTMAAGSPLFASTLHYV